MFIFPNMTQAIILKGESMKSLIILIVLLIPNLFFAQNPKVKVMMIFAHPDEGEVYLGGTTALFTELGHEVKFLSLTNGDKGHHLMKPKDLAERRYKEAMQAKEILGLNDYEIFNYHDGNLKNTKKIQREVVKSIDAWGPDLIFTYYSSQGGHNDNMTAGYIVRDAAVDIGLKKETLFMYVRDFHTANYYYIPDVALDISKVWEKKLAGLGAHVSQVMEYNAHMKGTYDQVQASEDLQKEYLFTNAYDWSHITPENLKALEYWYGEEKSQEVKYVESFEFAEFGRQIISEEVLYFFPMLKKEK